MKKIVRVFSLLLVFGLLLAGCTKDEPLFDGTDNGLSSFSITANGVTYQAAITDSQIILSVPQGTDLSNAAVNYELCEHAAIVPNPATILDWNSQYVFRVRSYSKTPREYTYTVLRTDVAKAGNVQLLTQTDVDNFIKLGITRIDGNLTIGSDSKPVQDSIVNLEGLSALKEVRYNIIVHRSFAGGTLNGLHHVERCGGIQIGTATSPIVFPALSGLSLSFPVLKSTGDIVVNSASVKSVSFDQLESVSSFFLAANSIVAIKAPMLKEAVGGLSLENSSSSTNSILPELSFPMLEKVGGKLSLQYFSGLTAVNLPKLTYVGGDVNLSLNAGTLEALSFPELATVGGSVIVERAPGLLKFAMPKVQKITSLIYNKSSYGTYPLERIDFSALETIDKEVYLRGIALESLSLPKLAIVGTDFVLWDLKLVTSISIPSIRKIGNKFQLYSTALLENIDISTLDTLGTLEFIGCLSLAKVKTPAVVGNVIINYASNATCPTPEFEGLDRIDGKFEFANASQKSQFDVRHVKQIGTLNFSVGKTGTVLNLYDAESIGILNLNSSEIETLNAPKLNSVDDMKITYAAKLTTVKMPSLKRVKAFLLSEHNSWGAASARMTDLSTYQDLAHIETIESVKIEYCNNLVNFSAFSTLIPLLGKDTWSVSNCGYNPTYQDMVEGRYVQP